MNNITRFLTAAAFAFTGAAAHANAAVEARNGGSSTCFQLTPLSDAVAADGASRTPQGHLLAENGASRTPQGQLLDGRAVS
jgi:hypothetical protein